MLVSSDHRSGGYVYPGKNQANYYQGSESHVSELISSYFGELTFGLGHMRERLSREAYSDLLFSLDHKRKISKATADAIALAIKEWAVSKGATHFCHWFQPMTGLTAEKHDAFITIQNSNHSELTVVERFSGSQLIQGEPDASSFPSGGMRSTFEARGYTAWDPTSPLFIVEEAGVKTLCIPSVFFGYHGQALDHKTPLLRSVEVLSAEVCSFLKQIGDVDVKNVMATLGAEQEYFLIDREAAKKRPDLISTGRTLIGATSSRGQRLEDHYFGSIPTRVKAFMHDMGRELYRLGVPIKTRHNEVAPSQFEMAPIFEDVSISCDHNTLSMETMKRVAARHGFMCVLHEKPFAGLNGSGKHCNWSMRNDKGENLLEPGKTPHQNLRFLAMIAIVMKAVNDHSDVIGASICSAANDLRLGGNEAPPTIISIFLGSMLENIFESIEKGEAAKATEEQIINLDVSHIPDISKDYTDRNRTSPFAFTGNKFEFRAVGSSANVAVPVAILNAAVIDAFRQASNILRELMTTTPNRDEAVMKLIRKLIAENKKILFAGNGYSEEWREEAKRRGLPNIGSCDEGFDILGDTKATKFLCDSKVFSQAEIKSRHNINVERYLTIMDIEFRCLMEMTNDYVIPAVEQQLQRSANVLEMATSKTLEKSLGQRVADLEDVLDRLINLRLDLASCCDLMAGKDSEKEKVKLLKEKAKTIAASLRTAADDAELMVADEFWVLPKYRDLLFTNF